MEIIMATMSPHVTERRHIPDRRSSSMAMANAKHLSTVDWIATVLMIIGGLNWGLVGLFNFNLIDTLFGEMSPLSRVIYVIVGLSALYSIYLSSRLARGHD
jgi:uncharacterized membrane protein YuzA (DUF378 family)